MKDCKKLMREFKHLLLPDSIKKIKFILKSNLDSLHSFYPCVFNF